MLVVIADDIDHRIRPDPLGVGLQLDQVRLQHPLAGIVIALVEAVGAQITDHIPAQQLLRALRPVADQIELHTAIQPPGANRIRKHGFERHVHQVGGVAGAGQ
jgi:hypothetical protein